MTTVEQSRKKKSDAIHSVIKSIRFQYQELDQRLKDAGIPHTIINTDTLIRQACRRNNVKEKAIRTIAGWRALKPGVDISKMMPIKEEGDE